MTRNFAHDPAPTIARAIPREPGSTRFYIRRPGETLQDFIVRIKESGRLPLLVEEPQHRPGRLRRSTGRPAGRPRKTTAPLPGGGRGDLEGRS